MRAIFLILGMASPVFADAPAAPDFFQQAKKTEESIRGSVKQLSVSVPSDDYVEEGLTPADPIAEGVDAVALRRLMDRADAERSDAVVILRNGKLIAAQGALDRKISAMSGTKSVISLAVGRLIDEGRIRSLDQPVSDFYPEWTAGEKSKITVRMLLNHTSGLDPIRRILAPEGSMVGALNSPLVFPPGTAFKYNNNAVDLLAGLIEKASGERADLYIDKRFFEPLGITDWDWEKYSSGDNWSSDRNFLGTPGGAGGLFIRPIDLAKIGQMVLDGGVWKGRRIVSASWIEQSAAPSQAFEPTCGFLWWLEDGEVQAVGLTQKLFDVWTRKGVSIEVIEALRPLLGRPMKNDIELGTAVSAALRSAFRDHPTYGEKFDAFYEIMKRADAPRFYDVLERGSSEGFSARGWLGQFLVIYPKRRLVGVRMRDQRSGDEEDAHMSPPREVDAFDEFADMVHRLVPANKNPSEL